MSADAIFISYRRADTGGYAGRLFDRLRHWFDPEVLFYDLDGIDSGANFPDRLQQAISRARVVLVVIGPGWLNSLNERSTQPDIDFVRREVELTLVRLAAGNDVVVLPVLMGGAAMPSAHELDIALQAGLSPLC